MKAAYQVGILFYDGKVITRDFLWFKTASETLCSFADIAKRYPNTIRNIWITNKYPL